MYLNSYYNGEFKNKDDIRIGLSDRAIFFGDGIYDAAIGRNGKIFMLDEHIERFFKNLNFLEIPFSHSRSELKELILKTVTLSSELSYFVYFQLTRYSEERLHSYPASNLSNLLITVSPFNLADSAKRLKLITVDDKRHSLCNIKTLNLLPAVLASHQAEMQGADEAVFIKDKIVTECSHSNIHIIRDSVLITHPLDNSILPGISRLHLLNVCERLGIKYIEKKFTVDDMLSADEVIVTSSSKLAMPVYKINETEFPKKRNSLGNLLTKTMRNDYLMATS